MVHVDRVEMIGDPAEATGPRLDARERAAMRDVLTGLDCDELQGYLFAKPMSAHEVLPWMAARSAETAATAAMAT